MVGTKCSVLRRSPRSESINVSNLVLASDKGGSALTNRMVGLLGYLESARTLDIFSNQTHLAKVGKSPKIETLITAFGRL